MLFVRDTRNFVNTFHVSKPTGWNLAFMQDLAEEVSAWWFDNYRQTSWNGVTLREVQVRLLDPANPLAYDLPLIPAIAGTLATPPAPGNATQTMSWRTGLAGRKHRGRIYTVGMVEADTNNDDSVPSGRTIALVSAGTNLLARLIAMGLSLAIFHKVDNTFTNVVTVVVENLIDSMRTRLASRGT